MSLTARPGKLSGPHTWDANKRMPPRIIPAAGVCRVAGAVFGKGALGEPGKIEGGKIRSIRC